MEEGKIPSDLFTAGEPALENPPSHLGVRLSTGRIGPGRSGSALEVPELPEEELGLAQVTHRFRRLGAKSPSPKRSLDQRGAPSSGASEKELTGFVLEALEHEGSYDRSEYLLEEVGERAPQGRKTLSPPSPPASRTVQCSHCNATNPSGVKFCVQCGGRLQSPALAPAAHIQLNTRQPPPPTEASRQANPWEIVLISINEDGSDGMVIRLEYLETTVGRDGDTRFPTDAFLSPKHARLHIREGKLFIEDLYSLNGTFLRLRDEVKLTPGDTFLAGRQVLRFERFEQSISSKTKSNDGTRFMGSPSPGGQFKILQIGIGGIVQNIYCLPEVGAVLGREKGDIIFPHDKFMSSRHAQIYTGDDGNCYLVDLTSSNGTWIKLWERTPLRHNDYIFMGQQLFRIHIKAKR